MYSMGVVVVPQMTSQPVSSTFLCFPLPSRIWRTPGLSLMLFSHLFFCLLCLLLSFIVPCKMVFAIPDQRETCTHHFSLRLFKMVRSSCGPALVIPNWFPPLQCCCRLCYPSEYLRLGTLVTYNWAQVIEACDCLELLSVYFDLPVDAAGVVCHLFALLGTDLHAVGCGGFVETPR